jgi:hypothetical protein
MHLANAVAGAQRGGPGGADAQAGGPCRRAGGPLSRAQLATLTLIAAALIAGTIV